MPTFSLANVRENIDANARKREAHIFKAESNKEIKSRFGPGVSWSLTDFKNVSDNFFVSIGFETSRVE